MQRAAAGPCRRCRSFQRPARAAIAAATGTGRVTHIRHSTTLPAAPMYCRSSGMPCRHLRTSALQPSRSALCRPPPPRGGRGRAPPPQPWERAPPGPPAMQAGRGSEPPRLRPAHGGSKLQGRACAHAWAHLQGAAARLRKQAHCQGGCQQQAAGTAACSHDDLGVPAARGPGWRQVRFLGSAAGKRRRMPRAPLRARRPRSSERLKLRAALPRL